ncbi:MAG: class I SAM-dependent methyltransferase [Hyphomonadaceae bacterium]
MGFWERYAVPGLISKACSAKPIMKQREKIVPTASGRVLEIGSGSGTNFALYDRENIDTLYALEPAPGMMKRARKTAQALAMQGDITFLETGAEAIELDDNSVDTAVLTFVLCTIPDWETSLKEIRRVLTPGGRLLFSEHGLAPDEKVATWQKRVEPIWKPLAGGCHLTRDIPDLLRKGGFDIDRVETMYLPSTPKIAGFVSWGSAKPA